MRRAKNIDLLQLEMDTLWGGDVYGRSCSCPLAAIAVAEDGQAVRFGPGIPNDLRQQLLVNDPAASHIGDGSQPPPVLETYRNLLAPLGSIHSDGGPSYVFSSKPLSSPSAPLSLKILTSSDGMPSTLAQARPEAWWEAQEWVDLLAGRLGPWAIGMIGDRVATLCHTPVASATAAEAGVWTHPEERGRGYAAIVTAAWARVAGSQFATLFYSTSVHNTSSQTVARKLLLHPIGWIWQLRMESGGTDIAS